jgi:hypothetical protein
MNAPAPSDEKQPQEEAQASDGALDTQLTRHRFM